jgi:hypothetical protein
MKKRIQIVTWLGNGNFGTSLQSYALYHFLSIKGYDCSILSSFNYKHFSLKGYLKMILSALGIMKIRERRKIKKASDSRKLMKLSEFFEHNIRQESVSNPWQYRNLLRNTDVFCVGSDQVWNAYFNFSPFNFLDFAGNVKRISYASSMGTKDFPEEYKETIKNLLLKFAHISLRETTGRKAVSRLTGRNDIKTVLDPTFLLTAKDWNSVSEQSRIEISLPKNYMLVYLIGNNDNYPKQVRELQTKTGIENVIVIPAVENPNFEIKGSIVYRDAAVAEFVKLIKDAAWVCTDSFHATALSINIGKNFTEFLRFKDSDQGSQNSRIYDVLDTFMLQNRLYNEMQDLWSKPIDYKESHAILDHLRMDSTDWLVNAIEA